MRVMTLNLHKGLGLFNRSHILPAMREAIRAVSADVVLLQEVIGEHRVFANRYLDWPLQGQYEFLADTIWTNFAYGKNAVTDNSHHGNALLSKFPITAWSNHDISATTGEARGALHCVLDWPTAQAPLHLCCVHLGLRERERQQQLHKLCKMISATVPAHAPLIVAGDFNDWRCRLSNTLYQRLGLTEALSTGDGRPARTYPVKFPTLRLDRVYSRNLTISNPQVLSGRPWSRLSDHAALTVDVQS